MTKDFNMKHLEECRDIARKIKDAQKIINDCEDQFKNRNVPYEAKKLLLNNPDTEFVEIKNCKVSYLTTGAVSPRCYSFLHSVTTKPAQDGKMLVEVID